MNKKDVEKIRERLSELTQKWDSNQVKIVKLQQQIIQLQQEVERLLTVDQSLRGGLSELERIVRSQVPEEKKKEAPEEKDPVQKEE